MPTSIWFNRFYDVFDVNFPYEISDLNAFLCSLLLFASTWMLVCINSVLQETGAFFPAQCRYGVWKGERCDTSFQFLPYPWAFAKVTRQNLKAYDQGHRWVEQGPSSASYFFIQDLLWSSSFAYLILKRAEKSIIPRGTRFVHEHGICSHINSILATAIVREVAVIADLGLEWIVGYC